MGCLAAVLLSAGGVSLLLGGLFALDLESKPGLRDNRSGVVLLAVAPGVLLVVAALVLAWYGGSRRGRVGVTVFAVPLLAFAGLLLAVSAPLLACGPQVTSDGDGAPRHCLDEVDG